MRPSFRLTTEADMSSFFTKAASQRKRKATEPSTTAPKRRHISASVPRSTPRPKGMQHHGSASGSDEDEDHLAANGDDTSEFNSEESSSSEDETAAEKRLRLAERYLDNIRDEIDEVGFDAAEIDRDLIAERLKEDVAESKGKAYKNIARDYNFDMATNYFLQGTRKTVTGVAAHPPYIYTVSSDIVLAKWEIVEPHSPSNRHVQNGIGDHKQHNPKFHARKRPIQRFWTRGERSKKNDPSYLGHTDAILSVACSTDGKYLATGGADNRLVVWDANTMKPLKLFTQHRDSVTGLAFRRGTNQLFSSSADRTIKIWSLDELAYVETLFGHQDEIPDLDALTEEKCVTVGARDRTARLWKVVEESQLVFRGGGEKPRERIKNTQHEDGSEKPVSYAEQTIDRISLISNDTFITGSSNGSLSLWSIYKKKPVFVYPLAHGVDPPPSPDDILPGADEQRREEAMRQVRPQPRWITALKAVPYSDLVISASWDGWLRAWRIVDADGGGKARAIEALGVIGRLEPPHEEDGGLVETQGPDGRKLKPLISGFVNDLAIFETGARGSGGLCIIAAVGCEHRLGRWKTIKEGRNGAMVLSVPRKGVGHVRHGDDMLGSPGVD